MRRNTDMILVASLLAMNLLIGLAIFGQVYHHEFLEWDDLGAVVQNPHLHGFTAANLGWLVSSPADGIWMPLTYLSYLLEFLLPVPTGAHMLVNPLFHILNATLAGLLVYRLLKARGGQYGLHQDIAMVARSAGTITSFLFLLHPVNVESAVWFSARKEVLCGFFFLLAVHAWVCTWTDAGRAIVWRRCAWFAQAAALCAKPMAVTLPVVFLLIDTLFDRDTSWITRIRRLWPYWLPSLVMIPVAIWCQYTVDALSGAEHVSLAMRYAQVVDSYTMYLSRFVVPVGLLPHYPSFAETGISLWSTLASTLVVCALLVFAWYDWRRGKGWWFIAIAWYLAVFFPVSGWMQIGIHRVADRYAYLPLLAPVAITSVLLAGVLRLYRNIVIVPLLLLSALLAYLCYQQTAIWKNDRQLWEYTFTHQPDSQVALGNLAGVYLRAGEPEKALPLFRRKIELDPGNKVHVMLLADVCTLLRNWTCALGASQLGMNRFPADMRFVIRAGDDSVLLRQPEQAKQYYQQALQVNPHNVSLLLKLALLEADRQNTREAIGYLDALLAVEPGNTDAQQLKTRLQQ